MARQGISEPQVFKAADKLQRAGTDPTIAAVREALGTGSYATISQHLKAWRNTRAKQSPTPDQPDSFKAAVGEIWATVWREAEESFRQDKKALALEKESWEKEREQMIGEIKRLEAKAEGLVVEKSTWEKRAGVVHKVREELIQTKAELKATEVRRREAAERGDRLEKELASVAKAGGTRSNKNNKRVTH